MYRQPDFSLQNTSVRTGILAGEKRAGSQPSAGQVATLSGIVRDLLREKTPSTFGNGKEDFFKIHVASVQVS